MSTVRSTQPKNSSSRRVLVTGASRGIGRATALKLGASGFHITVHCRSAVELAQQTVKEIIDAGGSADVIQFDIGDRESVKSILEQQLEQHGGYYGVVCNAGIAADDAFPAMSAERWDSVIHTNLDGIYNVLHPLIMPMIRLRSGGRIVTLSSVSGIVGNRGQVNYSAAKAGIIGATKALAIELAKRKITVNCVAPGVIETDMTESMHKEEALKMIPMGMFGDVNDIASTINFLFTDDARYITRQVIAVNGGMC